MTTDQMLRHLAARGYYEITPWDGWRQDGTPERGVRLAWGPRGQASANGFNPFCSRAWTGRSLAAVLELALEATAPPWHSLESLVDHMLYEQDKARGRLAS